MKLKKKTAKIVLPNSGWLQCIICWLYEAGVVSQARGIYFTLHSAPSGRRGKERKICIHAGTVYCYKVILLKKIGTFNIGC